MRQICCDDPPWPRHEHSRRVVLFWSSAHAVFHREYWEDGRQAPVCDLRAGETCIHDLKRDPVALLDKPYHALFFYLPRATLNAIADDVPVPRELATWTAG